VKSKRFIISPEILLNLFTAGPHPGGYSVIDQGIPEDAKFINVRHAWPNRIELLITSEEFESLTFGEIIPTLTPVLKRDDPTLRSEK
jgi:hypothetical protein